jgi:hypothetical protein
MKSKLGLVILAVAVVWTEGQAQNQVQINGYLSFQYEKGQAQSDFPGGTFDKIRAGLFFTGRLEQIFDYDLELGFLDANHPEIREAWVGIHPSEAFHLKLGMYLVPFGLYNTASRPYQTPFIQAPLPQAKLYPENWRDLGVLAEGRMSFLRYSVYLGNGLREGVDLSSGQQFKDNNKDKAFGGRLGILLSSTFEVGLSYSRGKYDDANQRVLELKGADVSWNTQGFRLRYEYGKARMDNPAGYEKGETKGQTVLFSFNWSGFSPVISYQTLNYSDPFHGAGFSSSPVAGGAGISSEISRWTLGLLYSPSQRLLFKVEYDFNREKAVELKNDALLVQVALQF